MGFEDQHYIPTVITATAPPVVTVADHGLSAYQRLRATRFVATPASEATGMEQLNNREYVIHNPDADTFELWDVQGQPIDASGYTAFVSTGLAQFTRTGPELDYENAI